MLEGLAIAGIGILLFVLAFVVALIGAGALSPLLVLGGVALIVIGLFVQSFQLVIDFIITNWYIVLPVIAVIGYLVYKSKLKIPNIQPK